MMGMETMYLPRLATSLLRTVSASDTTLITLDAESAYNLTPDEQQFLTVEVQPGSMIGADGLPVASGQVGISVVPPELVEGMLPPGLLKHTFDITVQAMGFTNFSTPAPMTFPNVFGAPPGSQQNFLSFDHTTGRLVVEGTATVSQDGLSVRTDPGTGITHPGWHGLAPPGTQTDQCKPSDEQQPILVEPVPVVGEPGSFEDLRDHLFVKDGDGFTIIFGNDAEFENRASCPEPGPTAMAVDLTVEGPAGKFLFGLPETQPDQPIRHILQPGDRVENRVEAAPLEQDIKSAMEDILYGVKVTIELYWIVSKVDERFIDRKYFYVYRYFDVYDNDHADGTLEMADTTVDGSSGVERRRPLKFEGGSSLSKPTFEIDRNRSSPFRFENDQFVFDPDTV
jgi:hypothetical protein